jgi:HEAT repeat protein
MVDVRRVLDPDEVDYDAASQLGPEALPHLRILVESEEPGIAAKAAYLAGRIGDEQSEGVVALAAGNSDARVRVAAVSAASMLDPDAANRVLTDLVVDDDVGVQKLAVRSVSAHPSSNLRANLERVSETSPEDSLRQMAAGALRDRPDP